MLLGVDRRALGVPLGKTRDSIYCFDARTGKRLWEFIADGRIDSPPTYVQGLVVFGSADGHVYCLDAADGSQIWKYRAGPSDEKVIGNGRMISLWPVRTGVTVIRPRLGLARDEPLFAGCLWPCQQQYLVLAVIYLGQDGQRCNIRVRCQPVHGAQGGQ